MTWQFEHSRAKKNVFKLFQASNFYASASEQKVFHHQRMSKFALSFGTLPPDSQTFFRNFIYYVVLIMLTHLKEQNMTYYLSKTSKNKTLPLIPVALLSLAM